MQVKLLALDVDGTLCSDGSRVSWAVRSAIHRAARAGLQIVLATGRRYRTTRDVIAAIDLPIEAICLGGALHKSASGVTESSQQLTAGSAMTVLRSARALGLAVIVQRDGHLLEQRDFVIDAVVAGNAATTRYFDMGRPFGQRGDAEAAVAASEGLSIGVFGDAEPLQALAGELERACPTALACVCMPSNVAGAHYLEVTASHVNKWFGIDRVARRTGISAAAVCAIGDQVNDLPMFAGAGLAIAMGNAPPSVRAAADWVAPPADAHGVAVAIDRLLAGSLP